MTKRYFETCKTCEDVKQMYKKLARELHPDCNPGKDTTEEFKEMSNQYQEAYNRLKDVHVNADGETYTKETTQTAAEYADLIEKLLHIPGIMIELCGSWLWITGKTYEAREKLKELNFRYSSKKQAWYFHSEPYKKHGKSEKSMDDIRHMYGSERYATSTEPERITA
jgi:curved DNA-binding protein CbpA